MKWFEIRDPVYGFIGFNEWEKEIIDNYAFQRLRRIKQLAFTDLIYPGAMHTRFEHSLGVMHLATRMYDAIVKDERNIRLLKDQIGYDEAGLKRDRQLIRLAALLHDIGHAPFSHGSEEVLASKNHEVYSAKIIRDILKDVIEDHPFNKTNYNIAANEISALIEGNMAILKNRSFWKVLISSQLDADRCDYLLRDSYHIGVKYGVYDLDRLVVSLSLGINPETKDIVLGISKGGWHVAESLIVARYQMFTQVYYHKTRRAYDYMLKETIKETIGKLPSPVEIKEYLKFDDYLMWARFEEKNSDWFQNIKTRNHIRLLDETREIPDTAELERIENIKKQLNDNKIWYWEDSPEEAKSWYKLKEDEEIHIIDNGKALPLSEFSVIVKSLQKQYNISRLYVKSEDREKALKIKKEA